MGRPYFDRADRHARNGLRLFAVSSPELRGVPRVSVQAAFPLGVRHEAQNTRGTLGACVLARGRTRGTLEGTTLGHDATIFTEEEPVGSDGPTAAVSRAAERLFARVTVEVTCEDVAALKPAVLTLGARYRALSPVRAANAAHRAYFPRRRGLSLEWPFPLMHGAVEPPTPRIVGMYARAFGAARAVVGVAGPAPSEELLSALWHGPFGRWTTGGRVGRAHEQDAPTRDSSTRMFWQDDTVGAVPIVGVVIPMVGVDHPAMIVADLLPRLPCPLRLDLYAHRGAVSFLVAWAEETDLAASRGGAVTAETAVAWADVFQVGRRAEWIEEAHARLMDDRRRLDGDPTTALRHRVLTDVHGKGVLAPFGACLRWRTAKVLRGIREARHPTLRPKLLALGDALERQRISLAL